LNLPASQSDLPIVAGAQIAAPTLKRRHLMSSGHPYTRTAKGFAQILGAARAAGLNAPASSRNSAVQKAERDEVFFLALNDPMIAAAIYNARETLPGFLALANRPGPTMEGFAVKIARIADGGPKYFWIHPFAHIEKRFVGQINNTPRSAVGLKMGDTITFTEPEIVDWMYMDRGRMLGNYSARAMLRSAPPEDREAFRRRFGLDFDF
jgi:uncharacterized protein YegJ (DUF2314 family)